MAGVLRDQLQLFDSSLPLEKAHTIPNSWYHDPDVYAAECRDVFGGSWQAVGRLDQVSQPGRYLHSKHRGGTDCRGPR